LISLGLNAQVTIKGKTLDRKTGQTLPFCTIYFEGKRIGTKTSKGKQILLEDLMSENFLDLDKDAYGIYVPAEEVLARPKYQWLAYLSSEEVLKTNPVIIKYLKSSAVDAANEYFSESNVQKSVSTI
jgi:hypothetical protein